MEEHQGDQLELAQCLVKPLVPEHCMDKPKGKGWLSELKAKGGGIAHMIERESAWCHPEGTLPKMGS